MQILGKAAIVLVAAAAVGSVVWVLARPGGSSGEFLVPLGALQVDLPAVVSGDLTELVQEHEFRFRNDLKVPLRVASTTSSCSCTEASSSPEVVPPGGELVVRTITSLDRASSRHASVWVRFDDGRGVKMTVTASLRRPVVLGTSPPSPRPDEEAEEFQFDVIWAGQPSSDGLPSPQVESDRGHVDSGFLGWRPTDVPQGLFGPDGPPAGTKAFVGKLLLRRTSPRWPVVLTLRMPGGDPLEIQLRDLRPDD